MTTESLTDTLWKSVTLDKVYEFRSGLSKPASEFGSGYPFLTFKDVFYNYFAPDPLGDLVQSTDRERATCDIQRGDVFLTRTSETMNDLGMSCVALKDYPEATFNGFTKRLRPLDQSAIDPAYAGYYFRSRDFRVAITAMSTLSTRASLNNEMLARLTIRLPDIKTQQAIGSVLLAFDDKIELNRRMNRTLEQMAAAIFKAWFVDFEPVRAKASGSASFPGMPQPVFDALPATFADSELGPIPEGWEVKPLKDSACLTMGQSPKSEFYNTTGDGLPFHQGVTNYGERFPIHKTFCTVQKRLAEAGDILFSVRAPVGRINVADERLIVGRGLAAIRHNHNWQSFMLYCLKHQFAVEDSIGDGTVFTAVTKKDMEGIRIVEPIEAVGVGYESLASAIDRQIGLNDRESQTLAETRDALLPKLLSGEVRVCIEAEVA